MTIGATFDAIYNGWLPNSGYRRAKGLEFELYDAQFDPNRPDSKMFIYVPVEQ
jgi:AraC family transcriptional regulator